MPTNNIQTIQWFNDLQEIAQEQVESLAFPILQKIKYHDWFDWTVQSNQDLLNDRALIIEPSSDFTIHYYEDRVQVHMPESYMNAGIEILDLRNPDSLLNPILKDHISNQQEWDKVSALNLTNLNGGFYLRIPESLEVKEPIHIHWHAYAKQMSTRFYGEIQAFAKVTIVEHMESEAVECSQWMAHHHWHVKDEAKLNYVAFDELNIKTQAYIRRYADLDRNAILDWSMSAMNRASSVLDLKANLNGVGSSSKMATISVGVGEKIQGVNANIINKASNSNGEIIQHGVVFDKSTITYNGIGHILKAAKNAESQQESRLLMFSSEGRGDVNPILLIDEFEVQAGHAASMGKVDREQLYYLMSRGLSQKEAELLVMKGFLINVFDDFGDDHIRELNIQSLNRVIGVDQ